MAPASDTTEQVLFVPPSSPVIFIAVIKLSKRFKITTADLLLTSRWSSWLPPNRQPCLLPCILGRIIIIIILKVCRRSPSARAFKTGSLLFVVWIGREPPAPVSFHNFFRNQSLCVAIYFIPGCPPIQQDRDSESLPILAWPWRGGLEEIWP